MCDRFYEEQPQKHPSWIGLKPDWNDSYIFVKINITVVGDNETQETFKNCAPFIYLLCTKIDRTTIDDAEDLDLITTM